MRKAISVAFALSILCSYLAGYTLGSGLGFGGSLELVLSQRISIRNWDVSPVEDDLVRAICRSALFSAFNLRGTGLNLLNSSGIYEYDKEADVFILKSQLDQRRSLGLDVGQAFVAEAPCIVVIVWNSTTEPDELLAYRRSGIIIQNLYILAVRYNLGGVCVGDTAFANSTQTSIRMHLNLPSNLAVTQLFPLGHLSGSLSYPNGSLQNTSGNLPSPIESDSDVITVFQEQGQLAVKWKASFLSQTKLSNVLWAAYGYSLLGTDHRTVPSAYGEYPFQIYVCNQTGTYNYSARSHSLDRNGLTDKRSDIVEHINGQEYLKNAPALLVFCWNSQAGAHNASDSDSGGRFINTGYGCCLQNLYLSATVWNMTISDSCSATNFDALRNDLSISSFSDVYPMNVLGLGEAFSDAEPPVIETPILSPALVQPEEKVAVRASITDAGSGLKNATLFYRKAGALLWESLPMEYDLVTGAYGATIPGQAAGSRVEFEIIAYDFAENRAVGDNGGEYFVYSVVSESPVIMLEVFVLVFTVLAVMKRSRRRRQNRIVFARSDR